MGDIDDLFTDPNAGAYEIEESRVGPPLTYVGEKLRYSLEYAHRVARKDFQDEAQHDAVAAFRYGLTAYLGLYNMLGMILDHRKPDALLDLDEGAFAEWLNTVQREGSVTG